MLLRDLKVDQRFTFTDQKTPLILDTTQREYPSTGTFRVQGAFMETCRLFHEPAGLLVVTKFRTILRAVSVVT